MNVEKTYDRLPREELWDCVRKSRVAQKHVRLVQDMCGSSVCPDCSVIIQKRNPETNNSFKKLIYKNCEFGDLCVKGCEGHPASTLHP